LKIDYYDFFPVLSLHKTLLDEPAVSFLSAVFDIIFSLLVIWYLDLANTTILAFLIKVRIKGAELFF
jgi:putative colanic acid biosynthesis UDP-glucose lipid carrier transferase